MTTKIYINKLKHPQFIVILPFNKKKIYFWTIKHLNLIEILSNLKQTLMHLYIRRKYINISK